jgi:hypothetical protein
VVQVLPVSCVPVRHPARAYRARADEVKVGTRAKNRSAMSGS